MKKIDFIVLNWQSYNQTLKCIKSIKEQIGDYKPRIIIVDNESDVNKRYLLKEVDKIIPHRKNIGFAAGVNSALPYIKSQFVVLLNNDALMQEDWLEKNLPLFKDPQIGMVGGIEITPSGEKLSVPIVNPKSGFVIQSKNINHLLAVPFVTASNVIIRAKLFKDLHGLDEKYFAYYEDIDLCAKIISLGKKVVFNPAAKVRHKVNYTSNRNPLQKHFLICRNRYRFISKIIPRKKIFIFMLKNIIVDILITPILILMRYPSRYKSKLDKDRYYRVRARFNAGFWALFNFLDLFKLSKQPQTKKQYKIFVYKLLSDFFDQQKS